MKTSQESGNEWVRKDDDYSKWAIAHISYRGYSSDLPASGYS
jgi:hypothetical protein